jgi:hypothetical protein
MTRSRVGLVIGLSLAVAVLAVITIGIALVSFTGCYVECSGDRLPWRGLGFVLLTLALISVPVAAGWSTPAARRRSWLVTAGLVATAGAELLVDGLGRLGLGLVLVLAGVAAGVVVVAARRR